MINIYYYMKKHTFIQHTLSWAKRKVLLLGLVDCMLLPAQAFSASPSVYNQIIHNIFKQETAGVDTRLIDQHTAKYTSMLTDQGAFTDIDYASTLQTTWTPLDHLNRLKEMVVSYVAPQSQYYGNQELHTHIVKMLVHWYKANPKSTNWWFHEIGWAQQMGLCLSLMRSGKEQVPHDLETNILNRMKEISKGPDQKGSQGTGANKMDIALQWIYRTCLQEDQQNLEFAIQQFFFPIKFNTGQGIQSDFSYLQHDQQLYTGGYGASVLTAFFKVAFYLEGTPYADKEKNELISNFVRLGYVPAVRGQEMLYNAVGRGIAAYNGTNRSNFTQQLEKLMILDPENSKEYQNDIQRMKGLVPASYGLVPFHRHYWRGDHTIHQRPDYTMDVRMASTRTFRCENGNGDNLLGYFITEGGTAIVRRGDEYAGIYPVWDWSRLPGTTTPALEKVPIPAQWAQRGQSTFAGGVSNGTYGVTTYQIINKDFDINITAKKSWFFFDKEVVCMGSDIQSTNPNSINTTVNQCLLSGNVSIQTKSSSTVTQAKGEQSYTDLRWVNHDSISYYFPQGGDITIRNDLQKGSWRKISSFRSEEPVAKEVFKLWINHGTQPQGGSYLYYVVPNTESIQTASNSLDHLLTVNTDSIQAVYNKTLNQVGIVFHKAANVQIGKIRIQSSAPCVALFTHTDTKQIKVYIADPSYKQESVTLRVKFPKIRKQKKIVCTFKTDELYAGSTHQLEFGPSTDNAK